MQQKILNNRYELEQKIGEGGMARVYRGRDLRLNRPIAVKVLHSHFASDTGFIQRFHHEAQAAANLRHANIVDVYDVGQDGDIHYIVMEHVEGSDLKQSLLQQGPLPVEQAVAVAEAVAEGLDVAHRFGMVHRDVKPQNIIVGPAGQVKITDFGIAKSNLSTAMTETGVTFGTADYISPEQARGQPATPSSDIYSLGVTLYEMLAGRLPFTGDSTIGVAMQHVSADPPPPRMYTPRIPPQLEALVLRALSKDPAQRPATGREFARLLQNYRNAGEQDTIVRPVPPRIPPQPRQAPRSGPPSASSTARQNLPPRPAVVVEPPANRGLGFGGFVLALLLLGGVLGLVYVFASGMLDGLFTPPTTAGQPTAVIEPSATPAETPTAIPLVSMPNVVGLDEQAARDALQAARLNWQPDAPRNSATISAGLVLGQFPLAGTSITETALVTYALSLGPELVEVPDVERLRATDAQRLLGNAGFAIQSSEEPSEVTRGFVIRQEPSPRVRIPRGETVTLIISAGNDVIMPDLAGLSEDDAKRRITEIGLAWSYSDYQGCDRLPADVCERYGPGIVVSSIPRLGERVPRGTAVTLGVRAP